MSIAGPVCLAREAVTSDPSPGQRFFTLTLDSAKLKPQSGSLCFIFLVEWSAGCPKSVTDASMGTESRKTPVSVGVSLSSRGVSQCSSSRFPAPHPASRHFARQPLRRLP